MSGLYLWALRVLEAGVEGCLCQNVVSSSPSRGYGRPAFSMILHGLPLLAVPITVCPQQAGSLLGDGLELVMESNVMSCQSHMVISGGGDGWGAHHGQKEHTAGRVQIPLTCLWLASRYHSLPTRSLVFCGCCSSAWIESTL